MYPVFAVYVIIADDGRRELLTFLDVILVPVKPLTMTLYLS
jgi:hypothetical protein